MFSKLSLRQKKSEVLLGWKRWETLRVWSEPEKNITLPITSWRSETASPSASKPCRQITSGDEWTNARRPTSLRPATDEHTLIFLTFLHFNWPNHSSWFQPFVKRMSGVCIFEGFRPVRTTNKTGKNFICTGLSKLKVTLGWRVFIVYRSG